MIHLGVRVIFKPGHPWAGTTGTVVGEDPFLGWRVNSAWGVSCYAKATELSVIEDAT